MDRTPRRRRFTVAEVNCADDAPDIPRSSYEGIEACRKSGDCNMFEFNRVLNWCYDHEEFAAVVWMDENPSGYATGVYNNAWNVQTPTGKKPVDFGESAALDGLPQETLELMSDDVNEANKTQSAVVGKNEESRSFS